MNNIRQIQLRELENLIKQHPDIAAFGSRADEITDDWLAKSEQRICHELPAPYR
jgi:2-oxo-4-hydroxy-4-carboxy--5-ureidoimidazoline (OHCU) decarboxylase